MAEYTPDTWVVFKIEAHDIPKYYKVLAGWSGGYLDGDCWRMNSGITEFELIGDYYHFKGETGSVYKCHKDSNEMRMSIVVVWNRLKELHGDNVELVKVEDLKL